MSDNKENLIYMIPDDIKDASVAYIKTIIMGYCNKNEITNEEITLACNEIPLLYDIYNFSRLFTAMVNERTIISSAEKVPGSSYYVSYLGSKDMYAPMYNTVKNRSEELETCLFDDNFIKYIVRLIKSVSNNTFRYSNKKTNVEPRIKLLEAMLVSEKIREKNPLKYRKTKVNTDNVSIKDHYESKKEKVIITDNEDAYRNKVKLDDLIDENTKKDSLLYIKYKLYDLNGKKTDYDLLTKEIPLINDIDALSRLYGVFVVSNQMSQEEFTNTILDKDLSLQMYISVNSRTEGVESFASDERFVKYLTKLAKYFASKEKLEEYQKIIKNTNPEA